MWLSLPISQVWPVKQPLQTHTKSVTEEAKHKPPFRHGSVSHGETKYKTKSKTKETKNKYVIILYLKG